MQRVETKDPLKIYFQKGILNQDVIWRESGELEKVNAKLSEKELGREAGLGREPRPSVGLLSDTDVFAIGENTH